VTARQEVEKLLSAMGLEDAVSEPLVEADRNRDAA
jgi:hypothetical protein